MGIELTVENASFGYKSRKNVFQDISFTVDNGEILCILGSNGSGKTTLLKCIAGILKLKNGHVSIDNKNISSLTRSEIGKLIGYLPQEHNSIFPYTVLQVVLMGRAPHLSLFASPSEADVKLAENAIKNVGIIHLRDKPYTEISGGERQLTLIARVLSQQPKFLLLDEITSHLDLRNQALILRMVDKFAEQGISVIMSLHFPNNALLFPGRVAIMAGGKFLVIGKSEEVLTEKNLSEAYGIKVRIIPAIDEENNEPLRFCVPSIPR